MDLTCDICGKIVGTAEKKLPAVCDKHTQDEIDKCYGVTRDPITTETTPPIVDTETQLKDMQDKIDALSVKVDSIKLDK